MHDAASRHPEPLTAQMLDVGDGHQLYVETVGRADGLPVVYLHGGPGSGCQPAHRELFDPTRFRAVLFDQRGCGRSTPFRLRVANTTGALVADMEAIRTMLGIARWLVVGGSWGATLALAYAQAHPDRVSGLVLRAIFLGTRDELAWAFIGAMSRFYPRLYADFLSVLAPDERARPLDGYWRRILDPDPAIHAPAAWAWHDAERILSQVAPPSDRLDLSARLEGNSPLPSTPFMEAHYFSNECFLAPRQLMQQAPSLRGIPGRIIQGRYDLLCPPETAYALAALWPDAQLVPLQGAGHGMSEPGVEKAMRQAIMELSGNA
ncbi:MAG: proline iminopeptidase [Devosia sp.]|nr:proline iminopeptidase [Devosia sp.]